MQRLLSYGSLWVVLLLAGCGGGGGSALPSPFAGSWAGNAGITGTGAGAGAGAPATVAISVDSKGNVTGSWADAPGTDNASGSLAGSVDNGGTLTLIVNQPGSTSVTIKGVTNIAQSGDWQGSLVVRSGPDTGGSVVFAATRQ